MHELAIAEGIFHVAVKAAGSNEKIKSIHVRIGQMQHITKDSLQFAFDLLSEGTGAEGAQIDVVSIPAKFQCRGCGTEFEFQQYLMICPACNGVDLLLLQGEEILVDAMEMDTGLRIDQMNADMNSILEQHMMEEHGHNFDSQQD